MRENKASKHHVQFPAINTSEFLLAKHTSKKFIKLQSSNHKLKSLRQQWLIGADLAVLAVMAMAVMAMAVGVMAGKLKQVERTIVV